jgi:RHS repeat-associated protein
LLRARAFALLLLVGLLLPNLPSPLAVVPVLSVRASRLAGDLHTLRAPAGPALATVAPLHAQAVEAAVASAGLVFESNAGQTDAQVRFLARTDHGTVFFTPGEIVFAIPVTTTVPQEVLDPSGLLSPGTNMGASTPPSISDIVRVHFVGANPAPALAGTTRQAGIVNYYRGADARRWYTQIPTYAGVTYPDLYPGVRLAYTGQAGQLKSTYEVAPGADPTAIRWHYTGARPIQVDAQGNLQLAVIADPQPTLTEQAPVAWQERAGQRVPIPARYTIATDDTVGFTLAAYDPALPLTIDPTLTYGTYLGGSGQDKGNAIAVSNMGVTYITGQTHSTNFPVTNASVLTDTSNVFVTAWTPDGTALLYSTYLGGSNGGDHDEGAAIAVDGAGAAYVTGWTQATDFPTTAGAYHERKLNLYDAGFITKFSSAGAISYSTYFGGAPSVDPYAIVLDSSGAVYLAGTATCNSAFPLPPTAGAFQTTCTGNLNNHGFIAKLDAVGATLVFATWLGGSSGESITGMARDGGGNLYLTGTTNSANFPTQNPIQARQAGYDAFVTKMNPTGTGLIYSTFLGGNYDDHGNAITVDGAGNAYVTGDTKSCSTGTNPFPTVNAYQTNIAGTCGTALSDAFMTGVNAGGGAWTYSTYLGGSTGYADYGLAITSAGAGTVYIAGKAGAGNFPQVDPLPGQVRGGVYDAFVAKINTLASSAASLVYSTLLAGNGGSDQGTGIALASAGTVYVTGVSDSTNFFPAGTPGYQTTNHGSWDAFVAKIVDSGSADGGWNTDELCGCNSPAAGKPIDLASGNFWHTFPDLDLPGRGVPLALSHTYNSRAASTLGPLGYGWTHAYNVWVDTSDPTLYYVHEGNGTIVPFPKSGPAYRRTLAQFQANVGGTYTLTQTQTGLRLSFGTDGKLTQITDRNNYSTSLSYTSGRLQTVTDPASRTLSFGYTLTSTTWYLTSVTDSSSRSVSFGYDSAGNLQTANDVTGRRTGFTYTASHLLATMTDPNGGITTNTYDASNRVSTQIDALQHSLQLSYQTLDTVRSQTILTDALGYTSVYTYNQNRLTALTRNPGPHQATWTFGFSADFPVGVALATDPNGHSTSTTWDAAGNQIATSDPLGYISTAAYNALNEPLIVTDTRGLTTTFAYDTAGNLTSVTRPVTETNQLATTTFAYDPLHPGDVQTVTNPLNKSWMLSYDAYGLPQTQTNPLNQSAQTNYDAVGRLQSVVQPLGGTTVYTSNAAGLPLQVRDPLGYTTVYTYDANLNLQYATDANGRTITNTYDLENQPIRVTYPDGTHRDTGYDASGNVISQTNELNQTTLYSYDTFNRLAQVTTPLTVTAAYSYDPAGLTKVLTDANGLPTTFGYDAANQLTSVTYGDGTTPNVSFAYNVLGQRTTMTDGTGTSLYTYDSLARLKSVQNGAGATVGYGYDLAGRLTTLTYPGSHAITRGYNDADQLTSVTDWLTNQSQFGYDADGNLTSITYPGAAVQGGFSYDAAGQLSGLAYTQTQTANVFLTETYTHDPVGVLSTTVDSTLGTHQYSYDPRYRATADQVSGVGTPANWSWAYDGATEITATSGPVGGGSTGVLTTTRLYNAGNQLTDLQRWQNGALQQDLTLSYSPAGNLLEQYDNLLSGTLVFYDYDQANRLTQYDTSMNFGQTWQYRYNGDGLRTRKQQVGCTSCAPTVNFTWDMGAGLPLLLSDGTAQYIYGPGGTLLEQVQGSTPYYYHTDRLGNVRALTNGSGTVQNTDTYDAYGATTTSTGSVANPFGYTGQYQDSESGLYYLRARYYDPALQQFLTLDPLSALTGTPYAYTHGDPVNGVDPSGLNTLPPDRYQPQWYVAPSLVCWWFDWCVSDDMRASKEFGGPHLLIGLVQSTGLPGLPAEPEGEIPSIVYRSGDPSPSNLKPRPIDNGELSFRDSLSCPLQPGEPPVFQPGDKYFGIDTSKLPPGSVIPDNVPPGHVSVVNLFWEILKDAVVERGKFPK